LSAKAVELQENHKIGHDRVRVAHHGLNGVGRSPRSKAIWSWKMAIPKPI